MQLTENYDSYIAASGDEPGAAIFMSVFFIKIGFVPIGAEQDVRHPVRRSAHLLTDHIQVNIRAAFDDQLIMNVTDDEAVPECFHGVVIIPGLFEPPVRTLRATIPKNESHIFR